MKRLLGNVISVGSLAVILTLANAAQLKEARVTQVVSDVKLLPQQAAPRPAAVNDPVRNGTAVRTGAQSRSELTFTDLTITRLGANTIFSFEEGTRTMDLRDGAILFQVPKGSGGATIRTTAVTAAITGTTGIGEFHPATAGHPQPFSKWLCLEGVFHLTLPNGQSVELGPGKMVTTDGQTFSPIMTFNISQVMNTSLLINGFDTPLASLHLIQIEQNRQLDLVGAGENIDLFPLLDPANIIDIVDQGIFAQASPSATPTPPLTPTPTPTTPTPTPSTPTPTPSTPTPTPSTPTPTPGKFGALMTITSPDPYVITDDTEISTDPTITTNGQTDFGKIYRNPAQDGPPFTFLFGSTSSFDSMVGSLGGLLTSDQDAAVFKFTSLELAGDPTISTTGGPVDLALIGVNGITSSEPGGVLMFDGIEGLLLATQDGSITLGPEISFAGLNELIFYARGSDSMLDLASDVSTTNVIGLFGQGGINLSSNLTTQALFAVTNGDFDFTAGSIDAEVISITAGGNANFTLGAPLLFNTTDFHLEAGGSIAIDDALSVTQVASGQDAGLDISLLAGGSLNVAGALSLTTDASDIDNGGNILVRSGGNMTIGGAFTLFVSDAPDSTTGTGGNITVESGGSLTAGSLNFDLFFDDSDSVSNGENLTLNVGGPLTTTAGGVSLRLSTPVDAPLVSGGNLNMMVGGNASIAGGLTLTLINTIDTMVSDGANISASIGGSVTTGVFTLLLDNSTSGHIATGGNISVTTGNLTASSIDALINNRDGGSIATGGNLTFNINGTLTTTGDASLITSSRDDGEGGGTIGSNVVVALNAAGASVGGFFAADISTNAGGTVAGAAVNVHVAGNLAATGGAEIDIQNTGFRVFDGPFIAGSTIDGDAIVDVTATNITSGDFLDFEVDNNGAGHIGGDAIVGVSVSNNMTAATDIFGFIFNPSTGGAPAGFIGGDANINLSAGNITSGGLFDVELVNDAGGEIDGNALINIAASGNVTAGSNMFVEVLNRLQNNNDESSMGGEILGNATTTFMADGDVSADGIIELGVLNNDQRFLNGAGHIGGDAQISFSAGDVSSTGFFNLVINNSQGSIDGNSSIGALATSISTDDIFFAHILNDDGEIGDGASVGVATTGAIEAASDAIFEIVNAAGSIGGDVSLNVGAQSLGAASLVAHIDNTGGFASGDAGIAFSITSGLTANSGDANFVIDNGVPPAELRGPDGIEGAAASLNSAAIEVLAGNLSADNVIANINNVSGAITDNATLNVGASNVSASFFAEIQNQFSGTIGTGATINLKMGNVLADTGDGVFGVTISNFDAGNIGEGASLNIGLDGDVTASSQIAFAILNNDIFEGGGGNIGADALIDVTGDNFSSGGVLFAQINNNGGDIGNDATINFTAADIQSGDQTSFTISNQTGVIGGNATIAVNVANIAADSLIEEIDNSSKGANGSISTIDSTVSGTATVTTDATFDIIASDTAISDAININGGTYNVGGTFRAFMGSGTIALDNASVAADVLKVGALGTNGVLNIGGGTLSADTTLKLYASGSSGQLNFISDVTLGGDSAKILAANSITIFNGVVVTVGNIADENPADVYTNNANYSEDWGGNGSTTGTFAGSGANSPQPLDDAPPFDDVPVATHRSPRVSATPRSAPKPHARHSNRGGGNPAANTRHPSRPGVRVKNSDELLSLLDRGAAGAGGKITVPATNKPNGSPTQGRADNPGRASVEHRAINNPKMSASRLP